MPRFLRCSSLVLLGVLAVGTVVSPHPLGAQQDTGMMQHDSTKMGHGAMIGHDSAMGPDMMFMGAADLKAAGDYEIAGTESKPQIKLTDNFSVEPAPDLYLVLATGKTPDKEALYVAKLKQAQGSQSYDLPKGKDLTKYTTLLIWSKKQSRAVASAEWHPSGGGMMEHK